MTMMILLLGNSGCATTRECVKEEYAERTVCAVYGRKGKCRYFKTEQIKFCTEYADESK